MQDGRKYEFGKLGVAVENITAELLWFPTTDDKKEIRLAWQVFLTPANAQDYWLIRVDALTGAIIGKQNLTITCNWDPKDHSATEHAVKHAPAAQVLNYVTKKAEMGQLPFKPFLELY